MWMCLWCCSAHQMIHGSGRRFCGTNGLWKSWLKWGRVRKPSCLAFVLTVYAFIPQEVVVIHCQIIDSLHTMLVQLFSYYGIQHREAADHHMEAKTQTYSSDSCQSVSMACLKLVQWTVVNRDGEREREECVVKGGVILWCAWIAQEEGAWMEGEGKALLWVSSCVWTSQHWSFTRDRNGGKSILISVFVNLVTKE